MAQAPTKHDELHKSDPHPEPPPKKAVGEDPLLMPLAEPAPGKPMQTIGVRGEPIEDAERDPGTIAEEQRRRSAAMEAGASMKEVATTDLPDPTARRVIAPPPHPENDHRTTKK